MIEGLGVCGCLLGDPGQVAGRLSAQRVSWLRPAASFAAGHDPPPQLGGPGVQAACRDHCGWQRGYVGAEHGLVFDRTGHHQVPGSGSVAGPPDTREIAGLELVVARITIGAGREESDLVQVDVSRSEAGPQAAEVQLEADRRLADPGGAAEQQDMPAAAVRLAPSRAVRGRWRRAGLLAGQAEPGPAAAAVPDEPGRFRSRHAGRVHAHVGEPAGIHAVTVVPHLPHQVPRLTAAAPLPAGEPPHDLILVRAQPAHRYLRLLQQVPPHAQGRINDAVDDHAPGACRPAVPYHHADVARPDQVTARIIRRRWVTHAQLVGIGEGGTRPRTRQLGEQLPGDRGLADTRRAGDPQDRHPAPCHQGTTGPPGRAPAASITIAMPAILGSGSTRVNRITRADRLETQEPQQRRTRALPRALAALD